MKNNCPHCGLMQWVSIVSIQKPKLMKTVFLRLLLGESVIIKEGLFAGHGFYLLNENYQNVEKFVTHWMEIPS